MLYWAPKPITSAFGLEGMNSRNGETIKNPTIISRFVCVTRKVNGDKELLQCPWQSFIEGWEWIRNHNKLYCSCNYGTWRRRRQIGNISQVMHAHGSKNIVKENHLETFLTIQAGSRIQEINPSMFGGHHWFFFLQVGVFVGWYLLAFKRVGIEETLYAGRKNCCFTLPNV